MLMTSAYRAYTTDIRRGASVAVRPTALGGVLHRRRRRDPACPERTLSVGECVALRQHAPPPRVSHAHRQGYQCDLRWALPVRLHRLWLPGRV